MDWNKWEKTLVNFAHIVPAGECPDGSAKMTIEKYETGVFARRRDANFQQDTQLVYAICRHALTDTLAFSLFPAVSADS